jgi:hypothetical protein
MDRREGGYYFFSFLDRLCGAPWRDMPVPGEQFGPASDPSGKWSRWASDPTVVGLRLKMEAR